MSIPISPKYGLNSFIPCCFWCGREKSMLVIPGRLPGDEPAPRGSIIDTEPCDDCHDKMKSVMDNNGVLIFEVDKKENVGDKAVFGPVQKDFYVTGRMVGITEDKFNEWFPTTEETGDNADAYNAFIQSVSEKHLMFMHEPEFTDMFGEALKGDDNNAENID